jgi:UDP-N-acetylmuramyl pentapeptide phosphotransferase/UDP-N-acetylglucosamine-1-phosphate transferase
VELGAWSLPVTILWLIAVPNIINLIDGFDGLAGGLGIFLATTLGIVAIYNEQLPVAWYAFSMAGALLGFLIFNFPPAKIFLGDGGAYLIGFLLAELSVLLLVRNSGVSPMFPLLLCAYPIFETIFTMYRRKFVRGVPTAAPDGIHLHTLIHRRVMRLAVGVNQERRQTARNSMTSPYLWVLCLMSVIPSVLWWDNTAALTGFLFLFMASYLLLYWSIVRFKTPKWLVFRR